MPRYDKNYLLEVKNKQGDWEFVDTNWRTLPDIRERYLQLAEKIPVANIRIIKRHIVEKVSRQYKYTLAEQQFSDKIGNQFEAIRIGYGLTLRDLQELTGIHFSMIRRIETGDSTASREVLESLVNALNHKIVDDKVVPDDK